jgi:hypothetical protein
MTNAKDNAKQVSVRLEGELRRALEETAQRQCRTVSDQIRFFVVTGLEQHGERRAA